MYRTDDEGNRPVDHDHNDPDKVATLAAELGEAEELHKDVDVDDL